MYLKNSFVFFTCLLATLILAACNNAKIDSIDGDIDGEFYETEDSNADGDGSENEEPECISDMDCEAIQAGDICCTGVCTPLADCDDCSAEDQCIADEDCAVDQYCNDRCECNTALLPLITIQPVELDFGFLGYGETRAETIYIHNDGNAMLEIYRMEFSTETSSDFEWNWVDDPENHNSPTSQNSISIAPGETREFIVLLNANMNALYSGAIIIECNDVSSNNGIYMLPMFTSNCVETVLEVVPESMYHNFGQVLIGSTSAEFKVTLGSKYVEGNRVLSVGPFEWDKASNTDFNFNATFNMNETLYLKFGEKISFTVECNPQSRAVSSNTLLIHHDADYSANNQSPERFSFACRGIAPCLTIDAYNDSVNLGNVIVGQTKSREVTIKNGCEAVLTMESIELESAGAFAIVDENDTATAEINPGGSAKFTVNFTPNSAEGYTNKIILKSNGYPQGESEIPLRGSGVTEAMFCTPARLDFGSVAIGTTKSLDFVCSNNTFDSLVIDSIEITESSSVFTMNLDPAVMPLYIQPGSSFALTVNYSPSSTEAGHLDVGTIKLKTNIYPEYELAIEMIGQPLAN